MAISCRRNVFIALSTLRCSSPSSCPTPRLASDIIRPTSGRHRPRKWDMSTPIRRRSFLAWLHDAWQRTRTLIAVLAIIRFNLLIPALLAATLLFADQMIDILRAVGEDERRASVAW